MADEQQPGLTPGGKTMNLIPVGLKEAALDSPTFRATAVHFSEQVDIVEKWLEGFVKSASKLANEVAALEQLVNSFLSFSTPPAQVSETIIDQDYTVLALKQYGEGARSLWSYTLKGMKRAETFVVDPVKTFLNGDLRQFKEVKRQLENAQKNFDNLLSRYCSQAKTKEPSSLREDAFQLHESRKAYLKASMDFCVAAPQLRTTLDKLLVKVISDQWREMRSSRESSAGALKKWTTDIERVRAWSRNIEEGETIFRRELLAARKQLEENADASTRPSRDLEDYAASTVPYLGKSSATSSAPITTSASLEKTRKQGWLFLRTTTGKPSRTVWVSRWFYVTNGIFGWLVQSTRSGGVEESEKIGVLLCSVRPAFQEERRFCFEVKTKDTTILLQAETQSELTEWIDAFEFAKHRALEGSSDDRTSAPLAPGVVDAAFAVIPPVAPELAAKHADGHLAFSSDEPHGLDRNNTLPATETDESGSQPPRASFDVSQIRRKAVGEKEGESSRDFGAKIVHKLDLHRKSTASPTLSTNIASPSLSGGSIASLISASHGLLPMGPQQLPSNIPSENKIRIGNEIPSSTLAPSTFVNPPAPTNLSKTAVIVSGERGLGLGRLDLIGGMPSGIMANLWGTHSWAHINNFGSRSIKSTRESATAHPPSPALQPVMSSSRISEPGEHEPHSTGIPKTAVYEDVASRKSISSSPERVQADRPDYATSEFPNYYPLSLKVQDAQFRMLFPTAKAREKLVLVFRATWSVTEQQDFPGRVYVTATEIYSYSHHIGLVQTSGIGLTDIKEITAAPGRDSDFLYIHLKEPSKLGGFTRITVKTFLEPLKLLQRRLNFLVRNCNADEPLSLEEIMKNLIRMEVEGDGKPSLQGWEEVSTGSPAEEGASEEQRSSYRRGRDVKGTLRPNMSLYGEQKMSDRDQDLAMLKLPAQPVVYVPQGMKRVAVEKEFDISAKALFHVLFGDKSAVFQILYGGRQVELVTQSPWIRPERGHMRRQFEYSVQYSDGLGRTRHLDVLDYQVIDVQEEHLLYAVSDRKVPWHLPHQKDAVLVSKVVITHVAKSRCKLGVYVKVDWLRRHALTEGMVEKQALDDLESDALDLSSVAADQVQRMGSDSSTRRAIQIFGQVGQHTQAAQISAMGIDTPGIRRRFTLRQRTLPRMILELLGSFAASAATTILAVVIGTLKGLIEACSSHRLLVALLIFSFGANLFHSTKDSYDWWKERNARNYMAKLGVGPGTVMNKAVYLRDIDSLINNDSSTFGVSGNNCLSTFQHLNSDPLSSVLLTSSPSSASQQSVHRLHRTRESLGTYRHDLLVALRVLDTVEREVIEAEYETWLLDENTKCRKVESMLTEAESADSRNNTELGGSTDLKDIRAWYDDYCASCKEEQARILYMRARDTRLRGDELS